jgi:7-cyano-7-deazaguanine reductase
MNDLNLKKSPLGNTVTYISEYDPSLLFPIPRKIKRDEINVPSELPFSGVDIWNAFELSWLDERGKPNVAIAQINFPCELPSLIESKSLKLYLNSFNQTKITTPEELHKTIERDLSEAAGGAVTVTIQTAPDFSSQKIKELDGISIDNEDVSIEQYEIERSYLKISDEIVEETLQSRLLKSNCLVTGQPDWASLQIHYKGPKIDRKGLLKYIISFRQHNEFHEQCIERIFMDITQLCRAEKLSVYGRYTRRGGLDINPFRSNFEKAPENIRTSRQ